MEELKGISVLNSFPQIKVLGPKRLQALCDLWRETGMAKECGVVKLAVTVDDGDLFLDFTCEITHSVKDGDEIWFPVDDLLFYLADHGVREVEDRQNLKKSIIAARKAGGPDVYRRYNARPGPKLPVFITCKNPECANMLMTQFQHHKSQHFATIQSEIECPRCHYTYMYGPSDFHFGPNA